MKCHSTGTSRPKASRALLPLLLSSGTLQASAPRAAPKTSLSLRQRLERALRTYMVNRMGPKL